MAKQQRKYKIEIEDTDGNNRIITDPITIDFDVEKRIMSNISQASFTLYNLGEDTRNAIYKDLMDIGDKARRKVSFFAGYGDDQNLHKVFKGTLNHCYSYRQGVDFLTVVECDSGSDFLADSYVTAQVPEGTGIRDAILDFTSQIKTNGNRYIGNFEGVFRRAVSTADKVDKLVKAYTGGQFYIDDDDVFCLKDNEYVEGVLNVIDADSGLLGSPQREEHYVTFDMIFEPRIMMGQVIELKTETTKFLNGRFKVLGFHHVGTISESVCGTAKTTARVYSGALLDTLVGKI